MRGDNALEADETVALVLSNAAGADIRRGTAAGVILNDEQDRPGFQIDVVCDDDVPVKVRGAFSDAAGTWQRMIAGDIPSVVSPFTGLPVDDIQMFVVNGLPFVADGTDGAGGSIAGGGSGYFGEAALRSDCFLPYHGTVGFDPIDALRETYVNLYTTAMHEIGHALGFNFDVAMAHNLLTVSAAGVPMFTGQNTVREFRDVFKVAAGGVPISEDFGGGLHWEESIFLRELMTPIVARGMRNPLSRVTVAFFEDIGYRVRYPFADPYRRNVSVVCDPLLLQAAVDSTASFQVVRGKRR